ncbi:MAG: chromate efflux transporter [Beijerinckiaceae bacterium]
MTATADMAAETAANRPSLGELTRAFFNIGILSFGGATAQIAMMHTLVVDERKWLEEDRFVSALNLCMLLPGPEAQQVATYIGWRLHGIRGGVIAGMLFVLPGALLMLALSALYVLGTGLTWVDGLFFGIKAAVLAIVAQAVIKLSKRALKTKAFVMLAIASFAAFAFVDVPFPIVIIAAALTGIALTWNAPAPPPPSVAADRSAQWRATVRATFGGLAAWLLPVAALALWLGSSHAIVELALFFSKLAVLSFGGAYALLVWLADEAVARGWVTTAEMIAGLGLAETTPGPTILVTQFVGFIGGWKQPGTLPPLVAATIAAAITTWVTFAPSFLWIFAGAPWLDDLTRNRTLAGALQGITAAVVGAISWLAFWFALNTIFRSAGFSAFGPFRLPVVSLAEIDVGALALAILAIVMTFVMQRSMIQVILACAGLGLIWKLGFG